MASSESPAFTYSPLDRTRSEIRIICVRHSSDPESPIICEIQHASLDEGPHYVALSYTWGENVKTRSISMAGTMFPVTSNLFAALRRLRHVTEDCHIWIDAISINQNDVQERSQEVL